MKDGFSEADITIERCGLLSRPATTLISALNAELSETYPEPGATHFRLDPDEVAEGKGVFLAALCGGQAVGCGALRTLGNGVGELKRMYVRPDERGRGFGRRVLAALEMEARALGLRRVVLETGLRQAAALGLYEAAGYRRIPAYGEYVASPLSVCLAKELVP
jgi:GNAT superfamily N-acetyltransferase